jgi:large subunit ribosomal protein L4
MRLLRRLIALSKDGRLGGWSQAAPSAAAAPAAAGGRTAAAFPPHAWASSVARAPPAAAAAAAASAVAPPLLLLSRGFAANAAPLADGGGQPTPQHPSLEELVALAEEVAESLAPAVVAERASGNGGGRRRRLRQRASSASSSSSSSSSSNVYQYPRPVSYYAPVRLPVHALGGGLALPPSSSSSVVVGRAELPGDIFAVPVRLDILHRVVRWQMSMRQQGTHKVKDRSEVSGGGRKPWRQKGTGRARQGSTRAPQWRGGGVAHGPSPRSHAHRLPKKVRRLGLKCALSAKAAEGRLVLVDTLNPVAAAAAAGAGRADAPPKTRVLAAQLASLLAGQPRRSVLLVDADKDDGDDGGEALRRAARNLPGADVVPSRGVNVRSVLRRDVLVLTPRAAASLAARLRAPVNRLGASGRTQARRVLALRAAQARAEQEERA